MYEGPLVYSPPPWKMTIKLKPSGTRLQAWLTAPQINGQCSVITNLVTVSVGNVCEEQEI